MTRAQLFAIANAFDLKCDVERVTTGKPDGNAFREFEFIPNDRNMIEGYPALNGACEKLRQLWTHQPDFVCVRRADSDGLPYLRVSSFYCGPK